MSSEANPVMGNAAERATPAGPNLASMNPMDALNRRDIDLIKKSLVGMHRDNAELRTTIVALHARDSRVPTKSFFITMGVVWFVGIGALMAARPSLHAAIQNVPMLAHLSSDITTR